MRRRLRGRQIPYGLVRNGLRTRDERVSAGCLDHEVVFEATDANDVYIEAGSLHEVVIERAERRAAAGHRRRRVPDGQPEGNVTRRAERLCPAEPIRVE